jgi:hypothetical protein
VGKMIILIFEVSKRNRKSPMGGTPCTTSPKALAHYT